MPWGSKSRNGGSNDCPPSEVSSESRKREFKHGHFYDGNTSKNAQNEMTGQGSEGLARNQGAIRDSFIPSDDSGGNVGQKLGRIKGEGTSAHVSLPGKKISREI